VSRTITNAALFVLAFVPRLYLAMIWTRQPVWDGHYYDIGARSIADGAGYVGTTGGAWCHYPVGYSGLLGFAYKLTGGHPMTGPIINALLGSLLAVLVVQLARTVTSERRAIAAGVITALYPGLIAYTPLLMTEPTSAFALALAAWVAMRWGHERRGLIASGVLLGLAVLVRPQTLLCAPFIGLLPQKGKRDLRWIARAGATATVVAMLTVSPWTIRNCTVMDGCAFVSTNAGWNLAIGAFPRATGRFETLRSGDGCHVITGQVQQDRCWMQKGAAWIAADPARWLLMIDDKLGFTFDHESFPIGYFSEADPEAWPERRRALGRNVLSWSYRLILLLAALGVAPRPSRKEQSTLLLPFVLGVIAFYGAATPTHPFWPIAVAIPVIALWRWRELRNRGVLLFAAAAVATVAMTHGLFFGEDRYHMVISPLLCLLAACSFERRDGLEDGYEVRPVDAGAVRSLHADTN
jgi:4-amino-4-deoxy-L-arabinose transferase-like glycosyltransferase